ncbi:capsular biosynthesis protein [Orrella sp. JC864]|uniref:capsular biosynthesis protein n=1 Tax=Orrella sp. JC864 TaxID=3120298 RepID=UPI00300AE1C4
MRPPGRPQGRYRGARGAGRPARARALAIALAAGALLAGAPACGLGQEPAGGQWYPFTIDEDALAGAPEQSALNRPLGPADRLVVRDGHFYRVGPDLRPGTRDDRRVRLYGVNLSFGANFPDAQQAHRLARRLSKAGFNAVRLHHMDFAPGQQPDPRSILAEGPYPTFNPQAVRRLKGLIAALAAEGIYINLNLYVSYRFRPEIDGLPDFDAPSNRMPIGNAVHVYHPRMIALQEQNARQLIQALGLKDNPALAMVEINNESSLMASWVRMRWNEQAVPSAYEPFLRERWNAWLARKYGGSRQACQAWGTCRADDGQSLPLLARSDGGRIADRFERLLARLQDNLRSVLPAAGEPPELAGESLRLRDFLAFLVDTDRAYLDRLRQVVHEETDPRVPVTGTQMSYGGVLNFDSHAAMDYIDEHQYIDHPAFPGGHDEQRDWSIRALAPSRGQIDTLLALSLRRQEGKPFVLSEFNLPHPNPHGAEILPIVAAVAAVQDWDGLFFFDYATQPEGLKAPGNFTLSGDWGKYVMAGPGAQIFRGGALAPLPGRIALPLTPAMRYGIAASGLGDGLERTAARAGIAPQDGLRWQLASRVLPGDAGAGPLPPRPDAPARQQLLYDRAQQRLDIDAPRIAGYFGALDAAWRGASLQARSPAAAHGSAQLLLASLDEAPLARAARLLLSVGSGTVGTQPGSVPARPKQLQRYKDTLDRWTLEPDPDRPDAPSGARYAKAPAWLWRAPLCVRWTAEPGAITVYPLDEQGRRLPALPAEQVGATDGGFALDLSPRPGARPSPWYEIVRQTPGEPAGSAAPPACG